MRWQRSCAEVDRHAATLAIWLVGAVYQHIVPLFKKV